MAHRFRHSKKLIVGLLLAFTLLSLADLLLTWQLIRRDDERVFESNPVAAWWLTTYGWAGMTAFKLATIAAIGGLAGGLAFWRPRTSELILVFACGAQSAVAVHSVFLGRILDGPASPPAAEAGRTLWNALPENSKLMLLNEKSVQEELNLSEGQVRAVAQAIQERQDLRLGTQSWDRDKWNAKLQQMTDDETALLDGLGVKQAERLQQIIWQQRGPSALTDARVAEILQLTDTQKEQIQAIHDDMRRAMRGPFHGRSFSEDRRRPDFFGKSSSERLLAVLTAEQKAHWEQMLGEPFKGVLRSEGPPMRFPRPDFRRRGP